MTILCTIDLETREVSLPADQRIAAYDHNVDVIRFQAEAIPGFSLNTSTIKIAAQGPNKARHDYAVDPSTVQIEEETGYITFDWPIPAGVTEMPIGTFKYGDRGQLIFAVCAEIITGSTLSKAWHSDDGIITVVAHLEPESGGGEDPEEEATNAQKIAALQRQVGAISSGAPPTADSTDDMDHEVSAVYINTTDGKWYYWDGSDWQPGGVYGGAVTSTTFTEHGVSADDFAVGQALAEKADADAVGDLSQLETTVKDNLVSAINGAITELNERLVQVEHGAIPVPVKTALLTLFENVAFYKSDMSAEKAILEAWAQEIVSISLDISALEIVRDGVRQVIATTVPNGGSVLWESTNTDVATVDTNGVVQGVGNGQCNIVASAGDISAVCAVTVSGFVQYSVTNILTNCINTNSATKVMHGESYHAEFTSPQGRLETCTCTMGGVQQTVIDGVIDIAEVTGDIVITAVGAESAYARTNVVLDGTSYINTGVELFSAENLDRDFKLVVNFPTIGEMMVDPFGVIVGSMEEVGVVGYPGFAIRNKRNGSVQIAGRNVFVEWPSTYAPFKVGIKRVNGVYYSWRGDDESAAAEMNSTYITHTALVNCPVVLGCQLSNRGETPSRYWAGTIDSIEIKWI